MFANLWNRKAALRSGQVRAENENATLFDDGVHETDVRALATEAALATSLDASPAVVVGIYEYSHRYRAKGRRTA